METGSIRDARKSINILKNRKPNCA